MKRGFLNTSKAKLVVAAAVDTENKPSSPPKRNASPEGATVDQTFVHPDMLDLHKVPPQVQAKLSESHRRKGRTRMVFQTWPRDPNGKYPLPLHRRGKETGGPDLCQWGATLYDFYHVYPFPQNKYYMTTSTSSRLATAMRDIGELDAAADQLAWADREGDPREIPPCDIGELIGDSNMHIKMGLYKSMPKEKKQKSSKAIIDPFDFDNYPDPWPLVPFSGEGNWPTLHKRIPLHLLPKQLTVHDPWNILAVRNMEEKDTTDGDDTAEGDDETPWTEKEDLTYSYSLCLSELGKQKMEEEEKALQEERAKKAKDWRGYAFVPEVEKSGPMEKPLIGDLPPETTLPESTPVAHLYLAPKGYLGRGHHSAVYKGEWELPRPLLVSPKICQTCVVEQGKKEMEKKLNEKKSKMSTAITAESSTSIPSEEELGVVSVTDVFQPHEVVELVHGMSGGAEQVNERMDVPISGRNNEDDEDEDNANGRKVKASTESTNDIKGEGESLGKKESSPKLFTIQDPSTTRIMSYEGPVDHYRPDIQWQVPGYGPICEHMTQRQYGLTVPPTAKVQVAVKLSIQGDSHLLQEAENYQKFPSYFFEHWNGYNIVPPIHDPVPVGAVVPQFYGYYTPDPINQGTTKTDDDMTVHDNMETEDDGGPRYLSPIMLLEHCGVPVEVKNMSIDDRNECASLLFRFHHEGWVHHSFATRNIMMERGLHSEWPIGRMFSDKFSYRLIDFGRSTRMESSLERAREENLALRLFYLHHHELSEPK